MEPFNYIQKCAYPSNSKTPLLCYTIPPINTTEEVLLHEPLSEHDELEKQEASDLQLVLNSHPLLMRIRKDATRRQALKKTRTEGEEAQQSVAKEDVSLL
jgi:hypothetical protein